MQPTNQCRIELEQDTIVVTPVRNLGELDSELFSVDVDGITRLLEQQRARNVVIDFCRTEFFGSDAIHLFLKIYRRVRENRGRMSFCGVSPNEQEVLAMMALDTLWPVFETRDDAINFVGANSVEILVVDDSEVDRCLIGGLLTRKGDYRVQYADSGRTALAHMRESMPDLVITDLVMPEVDGLELVAEVRRLYPLVPLILLTAHGNESIAFEALERGAVSYVPKVRQAERLLETVDRVLTRKRAYRVRNRLQECPAQVECTFYLDNNPARIRPMVDLIQHNLAAIGTGDAMEQIRIGIALEEALSNALYHGNLEISSQEMARVRSEATDGAVEQMLSDRLRQQALKDRKIIVDVHITSHTARFVIRDDGPGFNREAVLNAGSDYFERGENCGTTLMCALMDEVLYNKTGNQVTLIKVP